MPGTPSTRRWGPDDQHRLLAALRKPRTGQRCTGRISIHDIITLEQPRKTFGGIPELADSIADEGLIHLPSIALLSASEFVDYVEINDRLWGSQHDPTRYEPLAIDGRAAMYPVLIAGERRLRACRSLWRIGCSVCRDQSLAATDGACFRRHFGGDEIEVTIYEAIGAIAALNMQYSENTHHPVPLHEEAEAYYLFFRLLRQVMPGLTMAAFARQVGRKEDWIRRALAFCDALPEIQDAVRQRFIPFTIAVELVRLQRGGFSPDDVRYRLQHFIASGNGNRVKTGDFRRIVSGLITNRQSGQGSLLELMTEQQEAVQRRASFRRTLGGSFLTQLRGAIEYLQLVTKAIAAEELGRVFAIGSVRKNLERLVELLEQINAHRRWLLSRQLAQRLRKAITEHHALNDAIRQHRRQSRRRRT